MAHQLAINNTTPVTYQPELDSPVGGEVNNVKERQIIPTKKPIVFGLEKFIIKKGAKLIAPYSDQHLVSYSKVSRSSS